MNGFLDILREYGPYVALPVVVAGLVQALKNGFGKFFLYTRTGVRILHFIPVVLGMVGGLLLPEETIKSQLLLGGALGAVSHLIYKGVTLSLASNAKLDVKLDQRKSQNPNPPVEDEPEEEEVE